MAGAETHGENAMTDHKPRLSFNPDRNLITHMEIISQVAQSAINSGLTAQDHIDGVKLSHQDFINLVRIASSVELLKCQVKEQSND